jgi:hypothetical protein
MPNYDRDGDGDFDGFDANTEAVLAQNLPDVLETATIAEIKSQNNFWEFYEDVLELFDSAPNNNSFSDGGNGSGDETPDPNPNNENSLWEHDGPYNYSFEFDGVAYEYTGQGNFISLGSLGGGGNSDFLPQ